jgi:hypothetical protein
VREGVQIRSWCFAQYSLGGPAKGFVGLLVRWRQGRGTKAVIQQRHVLDHMTQTRRVDKRQPRSPCS